MRLWLVRNKLGYRFLHFWYHNNLRCRSGADCSLQSCESGPDPRLSAEPTEVVTLTCSCSASAICGGKFKLQFLGRPLDAWLTPSSTAADLTSQLMRVPGISGNNKGHVFLPVDSYNSSLRMQPLCAQNAVTSTNIWFRKRAGDLPALSLYANLVSGGSLYFLVTA